MKPIRYRSGKEITTNIPKVLSPSMIVDISDTVIDAKYQESGGELAIPDVCTIKFGPIPSTFMDGFIVLDDIAIKINNILRLIDGNEPHSKIIKSIYRLKSLAIDKISSKDGILCRSIIGTRVSNSARAVLVPGDGGFPEYVGIPSSIMMSLSINNGDLVIVGRDPVIWDGSIEVLRAKSINSDCIELHPFIFKQFGADCDGDTVWLLKVPKTEICQKEANAQLLKFCKNFQKEASRASSGLEPIEIDWEWPVITSSQSSVTTGFSISPEDIIKNTDNITRFKIATGKDVHAEATLILNGLPIEKYKEYISTINLVMLVQKIYLGPAGAASNKLKLIASNNHRLLRSANYVSERVQQSLFDYKGQISSGKDTNNVFDLLNIVNMASEYRSTIDRDVGHTTVIQRLSTYGLDMIQASPIMIYIYTVEPLIKTLYTHNRQVCIDNGSIEIALDLCDYNKGTDVSHVKETIKSLAQKNGLSHSNLIKELKKHRVSNTLSNILNDPIYSLINVPNKKTLDEGISTLKQIISNPKITNNPFAPLTQRIISIVTENDNANSKTN